MGFFNVGTDIGIDLGTATVLVHLRGKGIVINEPSVVAIDKNTNKVLAVGEDARQMIGRTPGNIIAIRPLKNGVISDYDITERMLKYLIKKSCGKARMSAPRVVVCIPSQATEVEKRAVIDATRNSGAKNVYLIEEPLAAAIGTGIDISQPVGNMIVDIGGGTADIAVISLGGIVLRTSVKMAGDKFDESIIKYVRNKYKLMIGERTAENLKINVASVYKGLRNINMEIKGRSLVTGLPYNVDITTDEIMQALMDNVKIIYEKIHEVLEKTPPELISDISERGIIMTGGGSLLFGLDKYLQQATGIKTIIAEEPIACVAKGTGMLLDKLEKLHIVDDKEICLIK